MAYPCGNDTGYQMSLNVGLKKQDSKANDQDYEL